MVALPFLVLWSGSKWICDWLNQPLESSVSPFKSGDRALLRNSALRTWRFFREFSNREEHWLIPDIVQADPPLVRIAVSTTNLGLLLNSRQAAHDLGYLTLDEFVHDSAGDARDRRSHGKASRPSLQLVRQSHA